MMKRFMTLALISLMLTAIGSTALANSHAKPATAGQGQNKANENAQGAGKENSPGQAKAEKAKAMRETIKQLSTRQKEFVALRKQLNAEVKSLRQALQAVAKEEKQAEAVAALLPKLEGLKLAMGEAINAQKEDEAAAESYGKAKKAKDADSALAALEKRNAHFDAKIAVLNRVLEQVKALKAEVEALKQ